MDLLHMPFPVDPVKVGDTKQESQLLAGLLVVFVLFFNFSQSGPLFVDPAFQIGDLVLKGLDFGGVAPTQYIIPAVIQPSSIILGVTYFAAFDQALTRNP